MTSLLSSSPNNLPGSYRPFIVSLELVEESNLTVEYVINRPINEEDRQRKEGNEESLALSARNAKQKTPRSQITCWKCKKGHHSYSCPDEHEADVKKQNSATEVTDANPQRERFIEDCSDSNMGVCRSIIVFVLIVSYQTVLVDSCFLGLSFSCPHVCSVRSKVCWRS